MDHKGVPYKIRQGIERHQWTVVVYLPDGKTVEKRIKGTRSEAEAVAATIINKRLEKNAKP